MQLNQIFRSLIRDKLNSAVIIVSLAVGIASVNLIIIFLSRELRTDNFHAQKDQIFALKCDDPWLPGKKMYHCRFGSAEYMKNNFAQVEDFCRLNNSGSQKIIADNEDYFDQPAIIAASENFFRFYSYKLLTDNLETALEANNNLVISSDLAKKYFGSEDSVGEIVTLVNRDKKEEMIVTGIVKDFHYSDLHSYVEPAFISYDNEGRHLLVKASENQAQAARSTISAIWQKLIPDYPVNIESVGDRFEWFHRKNVNFKRLIGSCSIISLLLSMIDLFAISYQKTRSRTKEIGIRKINGANIIEILAMINKDFVRWTIIAFIIAVPSAWYAMYKWLENYAYKTEVKWWIFALSGIIVLTISLLTVSWQSWRAATRNPVESLRYE